MRGIGCHIGVRSTELRLGGEVLYLFVSVRSSFSGLTYFTYTAHDWKR